RRPGARVSAAARFSWRPRTKLSRMRTSPAPSATSRSTMCEPTSPAPPVTRIVCPSIKFAIPSLPTQHSLKRQGNAILLRRRHLRVKRQRQALAADALGHREIALAVTQVPVRLLQVDGRWVVQAGLDAAGLQLAPQPVALRVEHDEEV